MHFGEEGWLDPHVLRRFRQRSAESSDSIGIIPNFGSNRLGSVPNLGRKTWKSTRVRRFLRFWLECRVSRSSRHVPKIGTGPFWKTAYEVR